MSNEYNMSKGYFGLATSAIGAAVGAGVALLFAPHSGAKSRKLLARGARDITDKAGDLVDEAKEKIDEKKAEIKAAY